jgi:hypothetical protein
LIVRVISGVVVLSSAVRVVMGGMLLSPVPREPHSH